MSKWDYTTDVLIVGSGGGGMTAALVAKKARYLFFSIFIHCSPH